MLGHDIVTEADAVRSVVSLTGQLASVDEDLTGRENLILLGRLLGFSGPTAKARADELLDAFGLDRGRRQAREELLRRHAAEAGHRREHRRHAAADVPRRAHDRPRPALAQPGVGHHPRARRRGHHDPALHPVPRRGRPARRGHRRDRPRQGDRRGHARRSSRRRSASARCTCGCSTRSSGPRPSGCSRASSATVHLEADPAALSASVRRRRPRRRGDRRADRARASRSPTSRSASRASTRSSSR